MAGEHGTAKRVALLALGAIPAAGLAIGVTLMSSSGASTEPPEPRGEILIACQSGIEVHDGVETSSQMVERVPAGTPIPPGCRAA